MKIGDKVYIRENTRVILGLPDGVEYQIIDIINDHDNQPEFPINPFCVVLNAEEFGKDWREFFRYDELIPIEE